MRLLPLIAVIASAFICACNDENDSLNTWKTYREWRETNDAYYNEQKELRADNGSLFYTPIVPAWHSAGEILISYLNDRTLTEGNLTPMVTSVVDVKYKGWLIDGTAFDSSYTAKDSVFTTKVSSVIEGWQTALQHMRVGDSVRIVLPYGQAYGSTGSGAILPFSTLTFDVKLKDIVNYETRP